MPCMHCDDALCVKAAQDGAIYKRSDGVVIIDPKKSEGQKRLVSTCPYRVIYWNEEKQIPQKCTFCAHLLDKGWKEPRCVEVCPTGALTFGDLDRPNSEAAGLMAIREDGNPAPGIRDERESGLYRNSKALCRRGSGFW